MSNVIHNLEGRDEKYSLGDLSSNYTTDVEAVATLRSILIELRKMNIHLKLMSGLDVENYNVDGSD